MSRRQVAFAFAAAGFSVAGPKPSAYAWSYADVDAWPALCREGKEQSPVSLDLSPAPAPAPSSAVFGGAYRTGQPATVAVSRRADGCPQLDLDDPEFAWIQLDGVKYFLRQVHWHAPAEHAIGTTVADVEAHYVHDPPLVLGVLLNVSLSEDHLLGVALDEDRPKEKKKKKTAKETSRTVRLAGVAPASSGTLLAYDGSLTTPPCSEGVLWLVDPVARSMSAEQLAAFRARNSDSNKNSNKNNARPRQPLGAARRVRKLHVN